MHEVCATTLGHVHRETLLRLYALGLLYYDEGRTAAAERVLEAVYAGVGPQHPYTVVAAQCLRLIGSRVDLIAGAAS